MEAWKDNCLNDEYFSKWLDEMAIELSTLEESVAPDGWICQWDKYVSYNLLSLWTNIMILNEQIKNHVLFYLITNIGGGLFFLGIFLSIFEECRTLLTFNSTTILYRNYSSVFPIRLKTSRYACRCTYTCEQLQCR